MSTSWHTVEPLEQKSKNKVPDKPTLTFKQQQKQDALDLAELIYDIYKESESNVNIGANAISRKDKQSV